MVWNTRHIARQILFIEWRHANKKKKAFTYWNEEFNYNIGESINSKKIYGN